MGTGYLMASVSIIVPQLNHFEYTKQYVDSLLRYTPTEGVEYVFIDDGSHDGSDERLRTLVESFPRPVTYIKNHKNIGFGPSMNQVIFEAKTDLVCLTNNDFVAGREWLEPLLDQFLNDDDTLGMATGFLCEAPFEQFPSLVEQHKQPTEKIWHEWHKEGPFLIRTKAFVEVGGFDEQFKWATFEDWDLLLRMTMAGYKWGARWDSLTYHFPSMTQKNTLQKYFSKYGDYYDANKTRFQIKWYPTGLIDPNDGTGYFGFDFPRAYEEAKARHEKR